MKRKLRSLISVFLLVSLHVTTPSYAASSTPTTTTTTTTTPSNKDSGGGDNTAMMVGGAAGAVVLGLGATYLMGGFGGGGCGLNTEDFTAFTALRSVTCEISDQQPWIEAKCEKTITTVTALSKALKSGFGATTSAVTQAGNAALPGAGTMAGAYQAAEKVGASAATNLGGNVTDTAAPTAAVSAAITDHTAALQLAQGKQGEIQSATTECDQFQAQVVAAAGQPQEPELQAKVVQSGQQCGALAPPAPPGVGCEICHGQTAKLGKIIEEQNKMIAALNKAMSDDKAKRAAMEACKAKDAKGADTAKSQGDALKTDPSSQGGTSFGNSTSPEAGSIQTTPLDPPPAAPTAADAPMTGGGVADPGSSAFTATQPVNPDIPPAAPPATGPPTPLQLAPPAAPAASPPTQTTAPYKFHLSM